MKQPKKQLETKTLLLYCDFGCDTGFSQVAKELIANWSKDENLLITIFAVNDKHPRIYIHPQYKNVSIIPALSTSKEKKDVYCRIEFLNLLYQQNFDVVFFLNDVEVFNEMDANLREVKVKRAKENKPKQKTILYFPIDSEPRLSDLKVLTYFDEIVTYTEYAKGVLKPLLADPIFKKIKVIPHGCDTDNFKPLNSFQKSKIKTELFGSDKPFVFGTVNRNSARKDLGTLVIGFALFKHANQADAVLYLHCNPIDAMGVNMPRLCERLGLEIGKDVFFPKDYSENKGYDLEKLNEVYNSFDVFVTTTTSEGFGLTVTEAMATKTLVVCPKHTSLVEITDDGQNTISFMYQQRQVFVNDFEKIRFISNPTEVAHVMKFLYFEKDLETTMQPLRDKIEKAHTKVSTLKWNEIAQRFKFLIDKLAK